MSEACTVVVIRSLSYSGTTWVNLLLGCHERAFSFGPPGDFDVPSGDRPWKRGRCFVHQDACGFWPAFEAEWDGEENLFVALAARSGRNVIIINNPPGDEPWTSRLANDRVAVKEMILLRDGRAICASHQQHHAGTPFEETLAWFRAGAEGLLASASSDALRVKYEDVVADRARALGRIGEWLGLEYHADAQRFWAFEHHIVGGNGGTVRLLRDLQGVEPFPEDARGHDRYAALAERIRAGETTVMHDDRWRTDLTGEQRRAFDERCGEVQRAMGYDAAPIETDDPRAKEKPVGEPEQANQPTEAPPPAPVKQPGPLRRWWRAKWTAMSTRQIQQAQQRELERMMSPEHAPRLAAELRYCRLSDHLPSVGADHEVSADDGAGRPRVLELGCGPGKYVALLGAMGYDVVGVDPLEFPAWPEIARKTGAELRTGVVAESLPFEDQSFDAAVFLGTLLYLNDPDAGLDELKRVLKPGAPVVVRNVNRNNRYTKRTGKRLDPASKNLYTMDELAALLERHGFAVEDRFAYGFWPSRWTNLWWYLVNVWLPDGFSDWISHRTPAEERVNNIVFARKEDGEAVEPDAVRGASQP